MWRSVNLVLISLNGYFMYIEFEASDTTLSLRACLRVCSYASVCICMCVCVCV